VLPIAGRGLFAKRPFKAGEVVSVSPVLLLPSPNVYESRAGSVLMNYCISKPGSAVAMLPLNLPAMANHHSSPNMVIDWLDWNDGRLESFLNMSGKDVVDKSLTAIDIKYVATRDIAEDEELTIDYGVDWQQYWDAFMPRRIKWLESMIKESDACELKMLRKSMPIFRRAIEAPEGMFPKQWFTEKKSFHEDMYEEKTCIAA
jgi:hypothetical protein